MFTLKSIVNTNVLLVLKFKIETMTLESLESIEKVAGESVPKRIALLLMLLIMILILIICLRSRHLLGRILPLIHRCSIFRKLD